MVCDRPSKQENLLHILCSVLWYQANPYGVAAAHTSSILEEGSGGDIVVHGRVVTVVRHVQNSKTDADSSTS
jgi:hypothetical protein